MRQHPIALSLVIMGSRAAYAQPSNAEAEALFQQGVALMDAAQLPEACAAFEGSQQRSPAVTTLLNVATCRERNGQLATAWGAYVEVERQTRGLPDPTSQTLHSVAQEHAAKLQPRLSKLTINIAEKNRGPGLEIVRDATPVDAAVWNRTLPLDGGTYTITARAPGHVAWKATVVVAREADNKTVDVPALGLLAVETTQPRSKVGPLVLAGAAIALVGTGIVFELSAESTYDKYKAVGGDSPLYDSAGHKRYAAEGLAISGLACAAVGAWLYFRTPATESSHGVAIAPSIQPGLAGLQLIGRY